MSILNPLREARKRLGLSLSQAATKVGCSDRKTIDRYERGTYLPRLETAFRIADAYETTVDALFPILATKAQQDNASHTLKPSEEKPVFKPDPNSPTVMALYPGKYKLGVAIFAGPRLVTAIVRNLWRSDLSPKHLIQQSHNVIRSFIKLYHPRILVIERTDASSSRRSPYVRKLMQWVKSFAQHKGIIVVEYTLSEIKETLLPPGIAQTKQNLYRLLSGQFGETQAFLPHTKRRIGDGEPHYGLLYMAVALGFTHFRSQLAPAYIRGHAAY